MFALDRMRDHSGRKPDLFGAANRSRNGGEVAPSAKRGVLQSRFGRSRVEGETSSIRGV